MISFCSRQEELSRDGVFYWDEKEDDSKKTFLEVTRALGYREDGKDEGLNEELAKEMREKQGWSPVLQDIKYEGNKNKREIDPNKNFLQVVKNSHTFDAKISSVHYKPEEKTYIKEEKPYHLNLPKRLTQAFEKKIVN